MISIIIYAGTETSPESELMSLVRTLSALVPACIEGLVRWVAVAGASSAAWEEVADAAGCACVLHAEPERALALALAQANEEWCLVLRCGYAPERGFCDEMARFITQPHNQASILRIKRDGLFDRLRHWSTPSAGVLFRARLRPDSERLNYTDLLRHLPRKKTTLPIPARAVGGASIHDRS